MATRPIIVGTDEPQLQSWETTWQYRGGGTTNREFQGHSLAKISDLARYYAANGWSGTLSFQHDVAQLRLSVPASSVPGTGDQLNDVTDRWEIALDQEKPFIFENSNFLAIAQYRDATYPGFSQQLVHLIRKLDGTADANWGGFWKTSNAATGSFYILPSGTATTVKIGSILYTYPTELMEVLKYFVEDFYRGQDTFLRGKYVLKHVTDAPNSYAANVADFNVEKIYSIAQLLTETESSALWILPLPNYLAYKVANYPVPDHLPPNYAFGGLKTRSNAVLTARGRIEIATEYLIDAWPVHTYGRAD